MKRLSVSCMGILLILQGCAFFNKNVEDVTPLPRQAGIIRQVNQPEHYFIFESEKTMASGTDMTILRNGRKIGEAVVTGFKQKKFQSADIMVGAPRPGDLCQPVRPFLTQ